MIQTLYACVVRKKASFNTHTHVIGILLMIFDATKTVQVWSPKMFRSSRLGGWGIPGGSIRNKGVYVCVYVCMYACMYLLFIILGISSANFS